MSMRSYHRAMADSKVMFSLFDRVNRLLLRLSDRVSESDHPLSLDELLALCQMLSPKPCNIVYLHHLL